MAGDLKQASGSFARAWGDVLRRLRQYVGGRWTINQCIILHQIFIDHVDGKASTVRDLSESEGMSQQTVSNAIASLREAGLITEETNPDDARSRLITPTEKALALRSQWWSEAVGID